MSSRSAPWYAALISSVVTSAIAAVGSYYASGAGSSADQVKENEHRLTKVEDGLAAHSAADDRQTVQYQKNFDAIDKQLGNVWCAIRINHGEPCRP